MLCCWRRRGRFDDYDDYDHLHHRRNKRHATVTGFLLFGAFLLFLLVALSLPILKSIYLLEIRSKTSQIETTVATRLRFGVWGFCASRFVSPSFLYKWTHRLATRYSRRGGWKLMKAILHFQCPERHPNRVRWSTIGVFGRPPDHRGRDEGDRPSGRHPQGPHHPARAASGCRRPLIAHARACHRLVFRVPQVTMDHLPRAVRPKRNRIYHSVWRGPRPRYRRTEQDQG